MKKNIGTSDKIIRVTIALSIVALYYFEAISGTLAVVLFAIAGIFTLTTVVGTCPIYLALKLSSKKDTQKKEEEKLPNSCSIDFQSK